MGGRVEMVRVRGRRGTSWRRIGVVLPLAVALVGFPTASLAAKGDALAFGRASLAPEVFAEASVDGIAAHGNAVVAVGRTSSSPFAPVLWSSKDGLTWQRRVDVDLGGPAGSSSSISVTAGSHGFVVVLNTGMVLTSPDGSTWTSNPSTVAQLGDQPFPTGAPQFVRRGPVSVTTTDDGYAIIGNGCYCAEFNSGDSTPWASTSTDGISWTASVPLLPNSPDNYRAIAIVATAAGLLAATEVRDGMALLLSTDGAKSWQPLADSDFPSASTTFITGMAAVESHVVVVGSDRATGQSSAWTSTDGQTFEQNTEAFGADASVSGIAVRGKGFVAVGGSPSTAMAWTSPDGEAWKAVPVASDGLVKVAVSKKGIVAIGSAIGATEVWVAGKFKLVDSTKAAKVARLRVSEIDPLGLLGDPPTKGVVEIEVVDTEVIQKAIKDPEGAAPPAEPEGTFLAVRFKLTNKTNEQMTVYDFLDVLQISDGSTSFYVTDKIYDEQRAPSYWKADAETSDTPLNASFFKKQSIITWGVFDVPVGFEAKLLLVDQVNGTPLIVRVP